jgi:hypothetical protein
LIWGHEKQKPIEKESASPYHRHPGGAMSRAASVNVFLSFLILVDVLVAAVVPVQALDMPESLEPWKGWVLHDHSDQRCPADFDNGSIRRCWWPSWTGRGGG